MSLEDAFGENPNRPIHITDVVASGEKDGNGRPFFYATDVPQAWQEQAVQKLSAMITNEPYYFMTLASDFALLDRKRVPTSSGELNSIYDTFIKEPVLNNKETQQKEAHFQEYSNYLRYVVWYQRVCPEQLKFLRDDLHAKKDDLLLFARGEYTEWKEKGPDHEYILYLARLKEVFPDLDMTPYLQTDEYQTLEATWLDQVEQANKQLTASEMLSAIRIIHEDAFQKVSGRIPWWNIRASMQAQGEVAYSTFSNWQIMGAGALHFTDHGLELDPPKVPDTIDTTPPLPVQKTY